MPQYGDSPTHAHRQGTVPLTLIVKELSCRTHQALKRLHTLPIIVKVQGFEENRHWFLTHEEQLNMHPPTRFASTQINSNTTNLMLHESFLILNKAERPILVLQRHVFKKACVCDEKMSSRIIGFCESACLPSQHNDIQIFQTPYRCAMAYSPDFSGCSILDFFYRTKIRGFSIFRYFADRV
jgi:hypothetical protein